MQRNLALVLITVALLVSCLLPGCVGGVSAEQYEAVAAQLTKAKEEIAKLQDAAKSLEAEKDSVAAELVIAQAELEAAQAKIIEMEGQVGGLKEQYELVGATKAEIAEKIVRNYHDTHVYSTYDLYVCGDMASDVWNMLKAQGIKAIIVVGNKDQAILNILDSEHAWVLAEVAPGEYLALETTGGYVVPKSQNPLYYRGWYFDSPAELKSNNQLVREYNIRVGIRNKIAAEDREVVDEHNQASNQQTADKLRAVHDKLVELIEAQEAEINNIKSEIDALASTL